MSNATSRIVCIVHGQVQGVGYRNFVLHHATRLGLTGFVRNRDDGAVEVEAQGDAAKLEKLMELLRKGPTHAVVRSVSRESMADVEGEINFRIEW